jgi:hypothetical protein
MSTQASLRNQNRWKAAGMLVPGLLFCSAAYAHAAIDRTEQDFKVEAHPVVTIHDPDGTVTVRAWTKSDVMVISKRATAEVEVDAEETETASIFSRGKSRPQPRQTICVSILKSASPRMPNCRFTTIRAVSMSRT